MLKKDIMLNIANEKEINSAVKATKNSSKKKIKWFDIDLFYVTTYIIVATLMAITLILQLCSPITITHFTLSIIITGICTFLIFLSSKSKFARRIEHIIQTSFWLLNLIFITFKLFL